nr:hypothetical protein Iba_chr07cCG8790 [Ipomoea batatas]
MASVLRLRGRSRVIISLEVQFLVIEFIPGGGRDKGFPFSVAFAPSADVQVGILKFSVDDGKNTCFDVTGIVT